MYCVLCILWCILWASGPEINVILSYLILSYLVVCFFDLYIFGVSHHHAQLSTRITGPHTSDHHPQK